MLFRDGFTLFVRASLLPAIKARRLPLYHGLDGRFNVAGSAHRHQSSEQGKHI
jgi:hypothetical protein